MNSNRLNNSLAKVLEECLAGIRQGETIEACLARYPESRDQIEPLLRAATSLAALREIAPSDEYRTASKARLMARLQYESTKQAPRSLVPGWSLLDLVVGARKVVIPVALAIILVLGGILGVLPLLHPSPALAAQCTLSVFAGNVEVQTAANSAGQAGIDGMSLNAGARVRTAADARALLTFFEGSTVTVEPDTDVEILESGFVAGQATSIVLRQSLGRTWSSVAKSADPGSHYEIQTPSANAVARGTLFATDVDTSGLTSVAVTEGVVSVLAQGEEVRLPAQQRTQVAVNSAPAPPAPLPEVKSALAIEVSGPAVCSVLDPTGAATGLWPDGRSLNQIRGSESSRSANGIQSLVIPQPVKGEYVLIFRYLGEGTAHYTVQGRVLDKVIYEHTEALGAIPGSGWLVHLKVKAENGVITGIDLSREEALGGKPLEKVVQTKLVKDASQLAGTPDRRSPPADSRTRGKDQSQGQDQKPGQNQDQNQQSDQGKDQGQKPDQTKDQGQKPDQTKDQGQKPDQAQGQDQKPGQNQDQNQQSDQSKDQGQKPDQSKDQGQKPDQSKDQGQKPDQSKDQGQKPDQTKDQGQKPDQAQGQDQKPGQNQDQNQKPDQGKDQGQKPDQTKDQGQKPDQAQGQDQKSGQNQDQNQKPDQGKDQGQKSDQNQDQGQKPDKSQDSKKDK